MDKLIHQLNLKLDWELDGVYSFNNDTLYIQLINPHEGTDFKYVLRAEFKECFDKWSNCFYEEYFTDLEKDLKLIILDLKKMMLEKDKMLINIDENEKSYSYYDMTVYAQSNWQLYKENI